MAALKKFSTLELCQLIKSEIQPLISSYRENVADYPDLKERKLFILDKINSICNEMFLRFTGEQAEPEKYAPGTEINIQKLDACGLVELCQEVIRKFNFSTVDGGTRGNLVISLSILDELKKRLDFAQYARTEKISEDEKTVFFHDFTKQANKQAKPPTLFVSIVKDQDKDGDPKTHFLVSRNEPKEYIYKTSNYFEILNFFQAISKIAIFENCWVRPIVFDPGTFD